MARRIVDLSMPVHQDMLTFPRVPPPALCVYESHEQFAERIGAAAFGVDSLTGSYLIVQNDHVGTHLDARKHIVPTAGGPETIPLEWCSSSAGPVRRCSTNTCSPSTPATPERPTASLHSGHPAPLPASSVSMRKWRARAVHQ